MRVATKIDKAMTQLLINHPFFATILLRMERVEAPERPTMSTDGKHLWYNSEFVESLSTEELMGVLCHEALHPAMAHHLRKNRREHWQWNRACDYAINPIVLDAELKMPDDCLYEKEYRDMSAEEIYNKLDPTEDDPSTTPSGGGEGEEGDQSQGQGPPPPPDKDQDEQPSSPEEEESGEKKAPKGTPQWGQVEEPVNDMGQSLSPSEMREREEEIKLTIQEAAMAAKRQGKLPAGVERMIEELMEPKLDWRAILARWAGDFARVDYSFRFPNKKFIQSGFIMPSLKSETIGKVIFAIDTSGSMSQDDIKDVLGEVCGVMREYERDGVDQSIKVLWADTEVHEQDVTDPSEFKPKGRGGTEYEPVFDHIKENGLNPKAVVYLTDGYCDDFDYDPGCPVLWGLTKKLRSFKPPFGEVMVINQ
tara:strand:+ start:1205 stop:2467 length:1263 start_codon:yes stop_codon:yes gene_type:complete